MKGQRLFVRPIDSGDTAAVTAFLSQYGASAHSPGCGLVGKLVGELVAVLTMEVTDNAIRVDDLVVAPELRRKRIGRVMMNEVHALAAKMDRTRVEAPRGRGDEFLQRVGFREEGTKWVKVVGE
jgi:GNAT superfamily N-acetyltransferase